MPLCAQQQCQVDGRQFGANNSNRLMAFQRFQALFIALQIVTIFGQSNELAIGVDGHVSDTENYLIGKNALLQGIDSIIVVLIRLKNKFKI